MKKIYMAYILGIGWLIGKYMKSHESEWLDDPRACMVQTTEKGHNVFVGELIGKPASLRLPDNTLTYEATDKEIINFYVKDISGLILPEEASVVH
jgi:hypothetical protein